MKSFLLVLRRLVLETDCSQRDYLLVLNLMKMVSKESKIRYALDDTGI